MDHLSSHLSFTYPLPGLYDDSVIDLVTAWDASQKMNGIQAVVIKAMNPNTMNGYLCYYWSSLDLSSIDIDKDMFFNYCRNISCSLDH